MSPAVQVRVRAAALLVLGASVQAVAACGASVPLPPLGEHTASDERVLVPYPPPVPHVEIIPPTPEGLGDPVWIDGQWMWRGRRWEWQPGQWQELPEGSTYAPPAIVYLPDMHIAWLAGRWHASAAR